VVIIDDDEGMRQAMRRVLDSEGYMTETYGTAESFLAHGSPARARCLVLDVQLPGMSGLDLHQRLQAAGEAIPTLFVTAHDGLRPRALAMSGAGGCLLKPFTSEMLAGAVRGLAGAAS
jgi:FixJ family two-component response regulator